MPQYTTNTKNNLIRVRDAIITILKDDTYFKTLLKDAGDTEYYTKYTSDVIIKRYPLEFCTVKKYPAISIFPSKETLSKTWGVVNAKGNMIIQIADQSRDEDTLIESLWGYFQSLRLTVEPYRNLCNTVLQYDFVSAKLSEPYKENLLTQIINIEMSLTYDYSYIKNIP